MKYDFTSILERKGHDALAIDALGTGEDSTSPAAPKEGFDAIPMWVADMNFPTVPTVTEAIIERTKHPVFGYYTPRKEYFDLIIRWHNKRNGVKDLKPEHIGYENGVLGGLISAMNVLCEKGGKVLLNSPNYIGFTNSLRNNGYDIVLSPLKKDDQNVWRMDYDDMEEKIKTQNIHVAIFCSPHNPCGRVWEKKELEKAFDIFEKYDVKVISDEIWSDIILDDNKHIPTQSVSDYAKKNTVALYAPSKTFNLAGLIGSYHIIYDKYLRDRILKQESLCHYNDMNILSMYALIGAYQEEGYEWLDELRTVLSQNVDFAYNYIINNFEGLEVSKPQGTYMLFVDCEKWCKKNNLSLDELLKKCHDVGVAIQDGRPFHGEWYVRMNLASPMSRIKEAFERMDKYVINK